MRMKNLTLWSIKLQKKYGFYLLYVLLTALYLLVLWLIPEQWEQNIAALIIFLDPAAMGLFFMGAIVLLEKSQRLPGAMAVSPIQEWEYIAANTVSMGIISVLVGAVIGVAAHVPNIFTLILGTVLAAVFFTMSGIVIATKITDLNQFVLSTMPVLLIGAVPPVIYLVGGGISWLKHYPTSACIDLMVGKQPSLIAVILLLLITAAAAYMAVSAVRKMWISAGGVKL
ncbi:MAG: ABC transporter permease [Blautia sp.]|nr:ABC transporter permease [Blautia sp.]MCM1201263.1 hypothetical protein [Bacteroides fragilis]